MLIIYLPRIYSFKNNKNIPSNLKALNKKSYFKKIAKSSTINVILNNYLFISSG